MPDNQIEQQVGLEATDGVKTTTEEQSVSGTRQYAYLADGKEKEVVILDSAAGASSTATAGSGIPSAMKQQAIHEQGSHSDYGTQQTTDMPDRKLSIHQDTKP